MLERACLVQARGVEGEKPGSGPGWERRDLEAEGWERLALGRNKLSHEQRSVNSASTRDLITGCLRHPQTKIGCGAYHHLERLRCTSKWLSPEGPCLVYSSRETILPLVSVSISAEWCSTLLPNPLGAFSPLWMKSQALPGPSRLYLIWIHTLAHSAVDTLAFALSLRQAPSTQNLCTGCSGT